MKKDLGIRIKEEFELIKNLIEEDTRGKSLERCRIGLISLFMLRAKHPLGVTAIKAKGTQVDWAKDRMAYPEIQIGHAHFTFPMWRVGRKLMLRMLSERIEERNELFSIPEEHKFNAEQILHEAKEYLLELLIHRTNMFMLMREFYENMFMLYEENLFKGMKMEGTPRFNAFLSMPITRFEKIEVVSTEDVTQMRNALNQSILIRMKYKDYTYKCSRCGGKEEVSGRSEKERDRKLAGKGSVCLLCIKNEKKQKQKEKEQAEDKREEAIFVKADCNECHKGFITNARRLKGENGGTCSECKRKAREKATFYKKVRMVNQEVEVSKRRIYGLGRTERIIFVGEKRKSKGTYHPEDIIEKDSGHTTENTLFEREAEKVIHSYIDSEWGEKTGIDASMVEEIMLRVYQERLGNKHLSVEECVAWALTGN